MTPRLLRIVLPLVAVLPSLCIAQNSRQIPIDDMDNWFSEVYSGHASGGPFLEGHRLGAGVSGVMAFDQYGNAFVAIDSLVYVITSDDQVHLLAGVPGYPGSADGPADRACLGSINGIGVAPDGTVYLSDVGNLVVKKLARDSAGNWAVTTIAGQAGVKGHNDGPVGQSLLRRPEGIAIDSKGNVYTMDQDWLVRISPDGVAATLNPKGGTGRGGPDKTVPLESAKFLRIMGSGSISFDEHDNLYIGDKWNMVWWKADLKAGTVTNIAGGPSRGGPGFNSRDPVRDGKADDARFHHGGGPNAVIYDRVTGRVYTATADEHAVRAITPDGWVKTLGPWHMRRSSHIGVGPVKDTSYPLTIYFQGVDPQGRVYVADCNRVGTTYRFYRKPAYEKTATPITPNPLLPFNWRKSAEAGASVPAGPISPAPPAGEAFAAGKPQFVSNLLPARLAVKTDNEKMLDLDQTVARSGPSSLRVYTDLRLKEGEPPCRAVVAAYCADPLSAIAVVDIAPSGCNPVVAFDGKQFVVAYESGKSIYVRRVSADGKLIDEAPIKMGGQWEHRPAIATNGEVAVIIGARRPYPNPWGWNGPAAVFAGRLTHDGKMPERFNFDYDRLADGGFASLVDRAQWLGQPGWPAGAPGGFKISRSGYWPHLYSAVCWDGKTWVAAWVRAKMVDMALVDFDIFACRVDPNTMMPVGEPVLVAGGQGEPGTQSEPVLAGIGDGKSLLAYRTVAADGQVKVMARLLAGGPTSGPERVEPKKK